MHTSQPHLGSLQVRKVVIQIKSRRTSGPSTSSSMPNGTSTTRQRSSASSNGPALPVRESDNSTPEQRELVSTYISICCHDNNLQQGCIQRLSRACSCTIVTRHIWSAQMCNRQCSLRPLCHSLLLPCMLSPSSTSAPIALAIHILPIYTVTPQDHYRISPHMLS